MNDFIKVRVSFSPTDKRRRGDEHVCLIGKHVKISTERLETFCFREINDEDKELVYLAGAIAYSDRLIRRHRSEGWRRFIHIIMPVGNPTYWQRPSVSNSLKSALSFLTGDIWKIDFINRTEELIKLSQKDFDFADTNAVVIPFSNGMDSFSQSRLLRHDGFDGTPIRITAKNSAVDGDRDWDGGKNHRRVSMPFGIKASNHAEPSYRTRTFAFSVMAGLAAHLANSKIIINPEAGQGSFGPSLVPVGSESPHRGSHPGFSRRMSALFEALWNEKIRFEHPQKWNTKGQVLRKLKDLNLHEGWSGTYSCSQGQRQIHTARGKRLHCGLCSGCLLRRVSVFAAELTEPEDQYYWKNLSAASLEEAICSDARREPSDNDRDIAIHAIMSMESLARLADTDSDNMILKQNLFEAFDVNELDDAESKLRGLISAHRVEWRAFTASLGPNAWMNQQIASL